jgi:ATP:corrinoid adenosyltransferase
MIDNPYLLKYELLSFGCVSNVMAAVVENVESVVTGNADDRILVVDEADQVSMLLSVSHRRLRTL